jgi:hypothetical protein
MGLEKVKITLTALADGTANDHSEVICGVIEKIYLDYSANSHGNTDIVIKSDSTPAETFLSITDNKTDGWYYPAHVLQDNAGNDVTFDGTNEIYEKYFINDRIDFAMAQNTEGETITVYVYYYRK